MTATPSPSERTFGKYRLRRLLGKGGMGEVYEAYDTEKRRTVAIKVLSQQFSDDENFRIRFQRESHAAAILQEPHVIPIHDWGEIDGNLYIDMRLVQGQTLSQLLAGGPLEPERAVQIVGQVAAALDAAHTAGLVHRDVKPQNIIVTPADFAYLLDFGIAESRDDTHLTLAGQRIGSCQYMAPERFNDDPTTAATDVYSLACVLHESLSGKPPFPGRTLEQSIAAHLTAPPPRPTDTNPHLPSAFDTVIARGMAKEPDDRYGSAGALGRAARRALQATEPAQAPTLLAADYAPPPATTPPAPSAAPARDDRVPGWVLPSVIVVAAALLLGTVGVVIGYLLNQPSDSARAPATTLAHPTPQIFTVTETTGYPSAAPATTTTTTTTTTTPTTAAFSPTVAAAADTESAAEQRLRELARADRPYVAIDLAERWVPQLSSKRPGVVDQGVVWDNAMTLREHLQLRRHFPGVRLVWSGDWSTFSAPDYWVTVVGITYPDSTGALAWCRYQGFDRDHCVAKVISATRAVDGSTSYN
ncbi:serine/threonine-protein kinase [Mycolicibacillus trivialis]